MPLVCRTRHFRLLAVGLCLFGTCLPARSAAEELPLSSTRPHLSASKTKPAPDVGERDRLWQEAQDFAAKEKWREAIRAGRAAFVLEGQQFPERPAEACQMLESLCYWHTREREFPAALAAARELLERRKAVFSDDYWQTVDARLNVALVERLSKLTLEEWRQFRLADQLAAQAADLQRDGKNAAALEKAEQALPIYTSLLGRDNSLTLACLSNVLTCHLALGQYFKALPLVQEIIELEPRTKGTFHRDTVQTLKLFASFNESVGALSDAEDGLRKIADIQTSLNGPNHPSTISARVEVGRICAAQKKFDEARPLLVAALEAQRKLLGEEHLATAQAMQALGTLYSEENRFDDAEPLLVQSVALYRKLAGDKHLATASALNALGKLYLRMGRFQEANEELIASVSICLETLGENHPNTAKVIDNLARLYEYNSNAGLARQARLQCLRIAEESYGPMNILTADALEKVAGTYTAMNDFGLAEVYLLRAREIRRKLLGEEHPQTAAIVGQLAYVYLGVGDPERAEPLFHEALAVIEKDAGVDSREASQLHERLALLYQSQGKFAEAENEYRRALATIEKLEGPEHFAAAVIKVGLAQTVLSSGNCPEACRLIDEALTVYGRTLQHSDPRWFDPLGIAGRAHLAAGDTNEAEQLLARGLHIAQVRMQMAGAYESERQRMMQMGAVRSMLNLYLSLPLTLRTNGSAIYPHVLAWKGAIATRQWRDRQHVSDDTASLTAELQQLIRRLATLTLHAPEVADQKEWLGKIFDLQMRKEGLEQQLAVYSSKLQEAEEELRPADVQNLLPPDTALIDILQYTHTSFENETGAPQMVLRDHYVAFVVRRHHEVERIELGDAAPIVEAVTKWRQTRGFRPDKGKTDWATTVGDLLWPPLKPYVNDCQTLLISPDGILSQLAWNVLPGRAPDSYLIEDFSIGMVPVPQLLAATLKTNVQLKTPPSESLLLVGDIDYNASAGATDDELAPADPKGRLKFTPLKGTAAEVQALRNHFEERFPDGKVALLDKAQATEEAFWQAAPRHRWIHIATHGFFAPPSIKTALATQAGMDPAAHERTGVTLFNVGFLNGLALSGANVGATEDGDDGILTAAEISTMDLRNVDVAVLSGCETGLGQVQQGEGSFGMQRALQIAGVGATVGSLWTVPDQKTSHLMQRFYANLWDKKLTKLQALREAQLWMLNTGGVDATATKSLSPAKRLSPHFWAAFTLSGDWR